MKKINKGHYVLLKLTSKCFIVSVLFVIQLFKIFMLMILYAYKAKWLMTIFLEFT